MSVWAHVRFERGSNTKIAVCVMRRRQQVHLSHISESRSKMSNGLQNRKWSTWITFSKFQPFRNRLNRYREIATRRWPKMDAICCRREVVDGVISGLNVKIIEVYVVINFDVATLVIFLDFPKRSFLWRWSGRCYRWRERDLQPTGNSWWYHFRWGRETLREYVCINLWLTGFLFWRKSKSAIYMYAIRR